MPLSFERSPTSANGTFLLYTEDADVVVRELRKRRVRIGSHDLRIAAIALLHSFIVVTANVSDFGQVPNLKLENWIAGSP